MHFELKKSESYEYFCGIHQKYLFLQLIIVFLLDLIHIYYMNRSRLMPSRS